MIKNIQESAMATQLYPKETVSFKELARDNEVNAIVLTGAGKAFSAGGNLKMMQEMLKDKSLPRIPMNRAYRLVNNILALEKPIIAAVNGHALGLGATIALFCDVIFASENARFSDPHVSVGLVAGDGGCVIWPLLIGVARAKQYLMTKALDIGTSTGLSAIYMAWALSKTGGKLFTIEIDKGRYQEALANFKEAGLTDYIDARLADAHDLVKTLKGPFDFVFCDADKDWYTNYFIDINPKLEEGGCYTAHNVSSRGWRGGEGTEKFYTFIKTLPYMETTVDESGSGILISYKKISKRK